jgi:hypothetical protein
MYDLYFSKLVILNNYLSFFLYYIILLYNIMLSVKLLQLFHFLLSTTFVWIYFVLPWNYYLLINILVFCFVLTGYILHDNKCILVLWEYKLLNKEYKNYNDGFIYRIAQKLGIKIEATLLKKILKLFLIIMLMIYCYNYGLIDAGSKKNIFTL